MDKSGPTEPPERQRSALHCSNTPRPMKEPASHQMANVFPLMGEEELAQLAADIKANGLKEPILLHEGQILDGRNRWKACQMAGVEPRTKAYEGGEPATHVLSLNLHRRHLTPSQKAAVAVEMLPWFELEASKRRAHGATGWGKVLVQKIAPVLSGKARAQAAPREKLLRALIPQATLRKRG